MPHLPRRLRPLAVLAALLGLAGAPAVAAAASSQGTAEPRIVGGGTTSISMLPHQVAVLASNGVSGTLCGGTIRDAQAIVTAAHCVYDSPVGLPLQPLSPSQLTVRAGSDSYSSGGQTASVSRIDIEPSYPSGGPDVAVLTLAAPLALGTGVQPATLADAAPATGTGATVSGWGATSSGGSTSSSLRSVGIQVESRAACTRAYGSSLPRWNLCAGSPRDGEDACQGDSGGPLSVRDEGSPSGWRLVGIVSSGYECGRSSYPGLYTDVSQVRAFVGAGVASTPVAPTAPATPTTRDVLAPIARISRSRCARSVRGARRCTITLRVTDGDGSAGGVRVTGRAVPRCTRTQRRRDRCPSSRTLTARRVSGSSTTFRAVRTLPAGVWQLRFSARDALNTQAAMTRKTLRVRR